ncbi:MAG: hypothetical protein JWL73_2747 [Actinomycetia bacterium]|nr:hypothetical protein [Actinomycetes bacterium]
MVLEPMVESQKSQPHLIELDELRLGYALALPARRRQLGGPAHHSLLAGHRVSTDEYLDLPPVGAELSDTLLDRDLLERRRRHPRRVRILLGW